MINEIVSETENKFQNIEKIISEIQRQDQVNYEKISEINNRCDLTEEEWGVKEIISKFSSLLDNCESKYKVINEKVSRDVVKIFLFGKVSVGKSKLLNAMLGEFYFTSATAHTTSSFVHVRRSEDNNYKIKIKDNEESFEDKKEFIKEIERLSGNIKNNKATANQTIEVSICMEEEDTILKKNIEIVDCPGSGNKSEITDFIKRNSQDADIFIFVMNYALTDDDKVFFKYQAESSTKPDVFIVINSWDESDNDDKEATEMSEKKIKEECSNFLKHFGIKQTDEISERIYFLSAHEICQIRIECDGSLESSSEKVKKRVREFSRFEYNLKNYITDPHNNRIRRYKQEILQLQDILAKEIMNLKRDIFGEKNNYLIVKYEKWINDIEGYKSKIIAHSENAKGLLLKKLDNLYNDIVSSPNLMKSEWVTSQLEYFNAELKDSFQKLQRTQYKEFINFIKTQDIINDNASLSRTDDPIIRHMWNPIIVNPTDKVSTETNVVSDIVEKLAMIPIPNIPFQVFTQTVSFVGKLIIQKLKDSELEQMKQDIIQQLKSKKNHISMNIDENLNEINAYYTDKANGIILVFREKIKLFNEYWSKLEGILKEIKNN